MNDAVDSFEHLLCRKDSKKGNELILHLSSACFYVTLLVNIYEVATEDGSVQSVWCYEMVEEQYPSTVS
jgi:hypothetical protein